MSNERKAGAGLAAASGSAPVLRVMTKDIRGAKRNDWDNCPIARAMKRVYHSDNLEKAVMDALTHIGAWRDDSQVCEKYTKKQYATTSYGCNVEVQPL